MALPKYAMAQASFPEMYERELVGGLFKPFAELTLDALNVGPGDRLLDIACGTGIVARLARERVGGSSSIVGVDISSDMLNVARGIEPNIDWRDGDAAVLPLRDGERFDVVACQQGLQFVADKAAAAVEMRRALDRGGRLAVSTWRSDVEIPFFHELRLVAERHLGAISDQRHSFGDGSALENLLREAGFQNVQIEVVSRNIRMKNGATLVRMNAMALVGMSAAGMALDVQERNRVLESIVEESAPVLATYSTSDGIAFDLGTNLATARK